MVCLQRKSCVIHAERFRGELLSMGRYTNLFTFTFSKVVRQVLTVLCVFAA